MAPLGNLSTRQIYVNICSVELPRKSNTGITKRNKEKKSPVFKIEAQFYVKSEKSGFGKNGHFLITPPEATSTGPGFNRGSRGGARGRDFEERAGAYACT